MNRRIDVIVNPVAGGSRSGQAVARLRGALRDLGFDVLIRQTRGRGDAARFANEIAEDAALVVAVGGDGTVNEVVSGLAGRTVPVLIVPRGTENILAKFLGVRGDTRWLAAAAARPRCMDFDAVVANGRRFLCVSGVGFDADVVRRLERRRRGHISHFDYFWPLWRTFWSWRFPPLRVEVDGTRVFEGRGLAFVGNVPRYAIDLRILREAVCDDGLLDVCIYECAGQERLLAHSALTLARRHIGRPGVYYHRGRHVRVNADQPLPVEVDGELLGETPVEYTILPRAARFVVGALSA